VLEAVTARRAGVAARRFAGRSRRAAPEAASAPRQESRMSRRHEPLSLALGPLALAPLALGPLLVLTLLTSPPRALADEAAPPAVTSTELGVDAQVPLPPAADDLAGLRLGLRDAERRSELGTALYISSFVHLGGALAGLLGAIPVGVQSSSGLYAMIGVSIASFVGHVVTLSFAIHFDVTSGARRRRTMEEFLRQRLGPAMERSTEEASLVEALF
jgi:hypothetical protein